MQAVLQVQPDLVVFRINVLFLVVPVADRKNKVVFTRCLAHAQVILLVEGVALGVFFHVVVIGIAPGCQFLQLCFCLCLRNLIGVLIQKNVDTLGRPSVIVTEIVGFCQRPVNPVVQLGIGGSPLLLQLDDVGSIRQMPRVVIVRVDGPGGGGGNLSLALFCLLGRNDNHAVGSTGSVDGSGCSILQHGDALDVLHVQNGKILRHTAVSVNRGILHREAVNHIQRGLLGIHGRNSPDNAIRITGYFPFQHRGKIVQTLHFHFLGSQFLESTGSPFLGNRLVTGHHHLCQGFVFRFELEIHGFPRPNDLLHGLVTDKRNHQYSLAVTKSQRVISVNVRGNTNRRAFEVNIRPRHRLPVFIRHFALHRPHLYLLRLRNGRDRADNHNISLNLRCKRLTCQ